MNTIAPSADVSSDEEDEEVANQQVVAATTTINDGGKRQGVRAINNSKQHPRGSKGALPSPLGSASSFDVQVRESGMELKISVFIVLSIEKRYNIKCSTT